VRWRMPKITKHSKVAITADYDAQAAHPTSREVVYALLGRADHFADDSAPHGVANEAEADPSSASNALEPPARPSPNAELARCFLGLANLPSHALDRLSRYEATLCRQVRQILTALDALDRRKPQDRGRRFFVDNLEDRPRR
jgi:hypothetical protein